MKRILLSVALTLATMSAFAQGIVNFANTSATLISTNMYGPLTPEGLMGTNANSYYFALFVASSTVTNFSGGRVSGVLNDTNWMFTGKYGTNHTSLRGRFAGGSVALPDYPNGSIASFVAIGWSANIGPTIADLQTFFSNFDQYGNEPYSAQYGNSNVGSHTLGSALSLFGTAANQLHGFTLLEGPIPEPSVFALVGGGFAFWLARRPAMRPRR